MNKIFDLLLKKIILTNTLEKLTYLFSVEKIFNL